jgi:methionyl-tRNA synthetase
VRVALPTGAITCRYCRNVQATGSICEKCGMRLPVVIIVPQATGAPAKKGEPVSARCRACGAPAKAGERCGDCGNLLPPADA